MNYYKISYSTNDKNERVYPNKMKGAVFSMTQDHASEQVMVAATQSNLEEDGQGIVALTPDDAETLIKEFQDSFPKPPEMMEEPVPPGAPE
jgi:hypothetical protein